MTLIPELAAFCRASERVVPSMAAITRTLTPLVIMFSICASWLGMSSSAYCRLVPYPLLFRVLTILSPSAIQRADDFVGMEMPIVPLSWAKACGVSDISPTANVIKTNLNDFIFFGGHNQCAGEPVTGHGMIAGCVLSARKSSTSYRFTFLLKGLFT